MADLITHSLTYSKENLTEFILNPLFIQSDIRDIIKIRTDIQGSEKLDLISSLSKITKAYAEGDSFTPSTGVTVTQRTITVAKMKAEIRQSGNKFFGWVKEAALAKGVNWDDLVSNENVFKEIISSVFLAGLKADLQRQIFLGDTTKEVGVTGALDADYKEYDGFWTRIIADFASVDIPAAQRITLANAAVKQVDTVTLTGSTGTANITVNGVAYLATFATDLTTTATNFVTAHSATILAREHAIVVTSSGADVIFTAGVEGRAQSATDAINVSGDLAGTVAATTANTLPAALATDEAETAFKAMWKAMPPEMKARKAELKFLATETMVENYRDTLETDGTESAHVKMVDGIATLFYRGVEVVERNEWDAHITADFTGYYPHRALLILPENLVYGTDLQDADMLAEEFYDNTIQKNIFRVQYKAGTQYIQPNFIVAAY